MSGKLINELRQALQQREIDTGRVRRLIQTLQARERLNQWLSLGVVVLLAAGLVAGVVFSVGELAGGA